MRLISILLLGILAGCANVQPVVATHSAADAGAGYVAGHFTRMKGRAFAFVLKADDGREFTMPLGEDSTLPTEVKDQTVAIKVPPGQYTVVRWITYATLTREVTSRQPIGSTSVLGRPFAVQPAGVIHLGSYDLSHYTQGGYPVITTHLRIQPRRATQSQLQRAFAETYPNLAALPLRCVLCASLAGPGSP